MYQQLAFRTAFMTRTALAYWASSILVLRKYLMKPDNHVHTVPVYGGPYLQFHNYKINQEHQVLKREFQNQVAVPFNLLNYAHICKMKKGKEKGTPLPVNCNHITMYIKHKQLIFRFYNGCSGLPDL